jgi:[methyl-Co(III) methanol-specific corrinoid protein]:coenzyme M methyltransferase
MTPKERFIRALKLQKVDRPPVSCANQTATLEQMDRLGIYWPQAHRDPEKMAKLAAAAWEQTGLEGVGVPFCQTVEAEILGCEIKWGRKKIDIPQAPFKCYKSPDGVKVPENILEKGRIPTVLKALEMLEEKYGEEIPIFGHVIGPFSLAAHLAGMEKIMVAAFKNPDVVNEFTNLGIDVIAEYGNAMFDYGADVVVIENMFASVDIMGPLGYAQLAAPYDRYLINKLKGPTILHVCGNGTPIIEDMIKTGATGVSIDSRTDARRSVIAAKRKTAILGNVDTVRVLTYGTPEGVKTDTLRALEAGIDVIAPGCALSPLTPNRNIEAMVNTVVSYTI